MPSRWGCSNCEVNTTVPAVNNFRGTCKHIICENCILRVINRKKLLTKKTSERKASGSSVIEATCPCARCRGTIQVSQVWYEEKNSSVISLCDDEEDQGQNYCTAAVAQIKTEMKTKTSDDDHNLTEELKMMIEAPPTSDVGRVVTPKKRERDNVATPSPPSSNDDDESRFSEQEEVDEERMIKRIKLDRNTKISLPDPLEDDNKDDQFWSARNDDIEFTEDAFMQKSIFHLNSFVDGEMKRNKGFGHFVEQGIATPSFEKVPDDIASKIADMTQDELRDALKQYPNWGWWFGKTNSSGAGQVAMWLKRVKVGSFIVMRHEYESCTYTPEWLKERDDTSGKMEYVGPVYIIGVVTRKIKPYSQEEADVQKEMLLSGNYDEYDHPIPNLCLVDWRRIGYKGDLKEETQRYINRICQPTVVNICNDFKKVYFDCATAASLRQDLWDNSSPCEFVSLKH